MTHADLPALAADPRPGTRPLANTALGALGIELVTCTPEQVVARMHVADGIRGRGALLVLAETAASTAAGIAAGPARRAYGAELNASFPAPATQGTVVAVATPARCDDDLHVWRIDIHDETGAPVLTGRCTLSIADAAV